jgi:hypothetical protein
MNDALISLPPEVPSPSDHGQVGALSIFFDPERSLWGAPVGVGFSPEAARWLFQQERILGESIEKVMKGAHQRMWDPVGVERSFCTVRFDPREGFLVLDAWGASVGTEGTYDRDQRIRELIPHNTDSLLQQAVLCAGIAALLGAVENGLDSQKL